MKNSNRAIFIIIGLLLAAIVILVFLNRGDMALKRALQENRQFLLKVGGEAAAYVSLQDMLDMQPQEFTTRLATSASAPREARLQGVELRLIYEYLGIDASEATLFTVRGLDGYYSPLSAAEVAEENKIYICFAMDDEILADKSAGGWGPFLMVIRESTFAQRWCKYVEEIDAQL